MSLYSKLLGDLSTRVVALFAACISVSGAAAFFQPSTIHRKCLQHSHELLPPVSLSVRGPASHVDFVPKNSLLPVSRSVQWLNVEMFWRHDMCFRPPSVFNARDLPRYAIDIVICRLFRSNLLLNSFELEWFSTIEDIVANTF